MIDWRDIHLEGAWPDCSPLLCGHRAHTDVDCYCGVAHVVIEPDDD